MKTKLFKFIFILFIFTSILLINGCKKDDNKEDDKPDNPPHVHEYQKIDAKLPTCEEDGNLEYYICSTCDKIFDKDKNEVADTSGFKVLKLDHDFKFDSFVWNEVSSCKAHLVCTHDSSHTKDIDVDINSIKTNPSCEEDGYTTYSVTYDGHTDSKKIIDQNSKIDHNYVDGSCSMCGKNVPLVLNNTVFELKENTTIQLDISKDDDTDTITYSSNNTSILTVDSNGLIKGIAPGKGKVTIKSNNTNYTINVEFTVNKYDWPTDTEKTIGVYLGVKNYGNISNSSLNSFEFNFNVGGSTVTYLLSKVGDYEYHNLLEEGNIYELTLNSNTITKLVKMDDINPFGVKESRIIEGKVTAISKYKISIDNVEYELLESCSRYKITKAAGASSVATYDVKVNDNVRIALSAKGYVQNIYQTVATKAYSSTLNPTPGERTLTNFFKTALSAVGHALYVYGGAWDYQDVGSSNQARSIGVADSWVEFFYEHDATYNYKNTTKANSYYPYGAWNEYYYAGVDCSGYVGWTIYNIMNSVSGNAGYVMSSTNMAKNFSSNGWGTFSRDYSTPTSSSNNFKVGDIISMKGHVWICLGLCSDYSMIILHSTPSTSRSGVDGGGAQIGAIGSSTSCEAYKLAEQYNSTYYPDWYARYATSLKSYSSYLAMGSANSGKFSWYLDSRGVTDPDNLSTKSANEILEFIFS